MDGVDTASPWGARRPARWQRALWRLCDFRPLGPDIRRWLRKRIARRVRGPFDIEHRAVLSGRPIDLRFRLYPAENHDDRVLFGRGDMPEAAEHDAITPLLVNGMVFVDIGGNVGTYACFVGKAVSARLIVFEPHPRTYAKLCFNLEANGLPATSAHNFGVGDAVETRSLWSSKGGNIGRTSILKEGTANPVVFVDVPLRPLVDVLAEEQVTAIDLMKIDIEGFEDRALAPLLAHGDDTLLPGHIILETAHRHLWEVDLVALLEERGYAAIFKTPENLLFSRPS